MVKNQTSTLFFKGYPNYVQKHVIYHYKRIIHGNNRNKTMRMEPSIEEQKNYLSRAGWLEQE